MNKLQYSSLNQLWIPSVLASAGAIIWMYLLPSLAVGTPLKFVLGSLGPAFAYVPVGLVSLGVLMGFIGIALSRPRLAAIMATIAGLVTALAVLFPYFVGGE